MKRDPRDGMRELSRGANRICQHILDTGYPVVDIEIEREALREECARLFPERVWLYDLLYESRFNRLIEQWRSPETESDWALDLRPELPPSEWLPG